MIIIKTRQPDPELEQKIRMPLEREHIEAEQISIDSWEKLVLPGLTLDGMSHEVSCNDRKVSLTRLEFDLLLMLASHEGQIFSKEKLFRADAFAKDVQPAKTAGMNEHAAKPLDRKRLCEILHRRL